MKALTRFLRYQGCHELYFERGQWPKLDPLVHRSHDQWGGRTRQLKEPVWLFQLRLRLFCESPDRHRCASREQSWVGSSPAFNGDQPNPDRWIVGPDGNRACSYCGSMHFEDALAICRKVVDAVEGYSIDGTSKSYKVYIRQPGVPNASYGALKFYTWHATGPITDEQASLFEQAQRVSRAKLIERYQKAARASDVEEAAKS